MIITIDTTKDSQEDIRKAIALLQQIAHSSQGSYGSQQNYSHNPPVNSAFDFSTPSSSSYSQLNSSASSSPQTSQPSASDGFAAMFGDMGGQQVPVTSSLSNQPLSNVAASTPATPKKKEKYDFETY